MISITTCGGPCAATGTAISRTSTGRRPSIAETVRRGWFFTGQRSALTGRPRGSDPTGLPLERLVVFLQNHDQIGNRAFGDRMHAGLDPAVWRAASALLLLLPETPLLFMGQEWAASTPFLYFTDHHSELGRLVTEGRRREFAAFAAFADPARRERIPDPQAESTFAASRLRWDERTQEPHASTWRWYQRLLWLRRTHPALAAPHGSRRPWTRRARMRWCCTGLTNRDRVSSR